MPHEEGLRSRDFFDLAIDSKLSGCDLVAREISELVSGCEIKGRTSVAQRKSCSSVRSKITNDARKNSISWRERISESGDGYAFPSRIDISLLLSTLHMHYSSMMTGSQRSSSWLAIAEPARCAGPNLDHLQGDRHSACDPDPGQLFQNLEHRALSRWRYAR